MHIRTVNLGVEVHLPEGSEDSPSSLQGLASDSDLLCCDTYGDGVDCQAQYLLIERGQQRAVIKKMGHIAFRI